MDLSPRLQGIADQVPAGARFADVGTDHGYLPVWLLLQGRIQHAIASDLRAGPLQRARETAAQYGTAAQMDFRLCDGLAGIAPDEVDTIAIAGMGGETIAMILAAAPWTRQCRLLRQPMTAGEDLRQWLGENGYRINSERIACEGKRYYTILNVTGGAMPAQTPAELWVGRQSSDVLRAPWLDYMLAKVNRQLEGHRAAAVPDETAIRGLEEVAEGIRTMRKELDS